MTSNPSRTSSQPAKRLAGFFVPESRPAFNGMSILALLLLGFAMLIEKHRVASSTVKQQRSSSVTVRGQGKDQRGTG